MPKSTKNWDLTTCSPKDVADAVDRLKPTGSSGPDNISGRLIKSVKFELIEALTLLTNRCLTEGFFPDCLKCSKVIPVFKNKGSRKDTSNYRPIAIASVLGKVIETVVHSQLRSAIDQLLPSSMYGYRAGKSTEQALIDLTDTIKEKRVNSNYVAVVALDASAAFDVLDRSLVVSMLKAFGAGPTMINFINSFLHGVTQYVEINGSKSEAWSFEVGSGQGRILSPILYNVGTISLYFWTLISIFFGFADDGADVICASSTQECDAKISLLLAERSRWFDLAGMTLNVAKTQIVGFGFTPAVQVLHGISIEPSNNFKFLGMTIEGNLSIDMHVSHVCNKIRTAAARIRSEGSFLSTNDRRTLYQAWVNGIINSNGGAYLPLLNSSQTLDLQRACNQAIRAVVRMPRKSRDISITEIRSQLNLPSIEQIVERKCLMLAWRSRSILRSLQEQTGPTTRARSNGNLPAPDQKGLRGKMIATSIKLAWNRLPIGIKEEESSTKAKSLIKQITL